MSTKREEKKRLYKEKIIKAANVVFAKNGFNNSTIEQISKEAEVGVGTTYLYFKSKSELYRETIKEKLDLNNIEDIFHNIEYNNTVSVEICKVSQKLMKKLYTLDKEIIKEYINSFFKGNEKESNLIYNIILDTDNTLKAKYLEIFINYEEKKLLNEQFNARICSDILFNMILESMYKYISQDSDNESIITDLESKIIFLISPYEVSN